MLIPRLALLIALLPALSLLHAAFVSQSFGVQFNRMAVETELSVFRTDALTGSALEQIGRRNHLWALEVRDRSGVLLAEWQAVPLARLGLFGDVSEFRQPATGALVRWWVAPTRPASLGWGGLGAIWLLLNVFALSRLPREARAGVPKVWPGQAPNLQRDDPPTLRPRMKALLDAAPLGVLLLDSEARVRHVNPLIQQWIGRSQAQLRGRRATNVLPLYTEDADHPSLPWAQAEQPSDVPLRWQLRVAGKERPVGVSWSRSSDGSFLLALIDLQDWTSAGHNTLDRLGLLQRVLNVLPVGVLVIDSNGQIEMANRHAERQFARAPGELEGEQFTTLMPVPFLNQPDIQLSDYRGQSPSTDDSRPKVVGWRKDATTFPVGLIVEDLGDTESGYLVLVEDLTEVMQTAAAQSRLGRLFEQTAEEVLILDARSLYVREANRGAQENLGFGLSQLRRMTLLHLAPLLDGDSTEQQVARLRAGDQRELRLSTDFTRADGSSYPVRMSLTCSREEEPPVLMLLAHDVTAQRAAEGRLAWLAGHDSLTRLINRNAANEELARCESSGFNGNIVMVQVANLWNINLGMGHDKGDEVIAVIAERLQNELPEVRLLARWSGAVFLLLIDEDMPEPLTLREALCLPIETADGTVNPEIKVGNVEWTGRALSSLKAVQSAVNESKAPESAV